MTERVGHRKNVLSKGDVSVNLAWSQLRMSINSAKPVPPPKMIA